MEFIDTIKKERLQVIIDNVDYDGEKLQSERRPKFIIYGSSLNDINAEIPELRQTIFDTTVFFTVGEILLYRPSFLFDFRNNRIMFNTASSRKLLETTAKASGTCRFVRHNKKQPESILSWKPFFG